MIRALPSARLSLSVAILIALSIALSSVPHSATAQLPPPVEVRIEGVFGNDALIGDGYSTVAITLRNLTRETFRGRVLLRAVQWGQPAERHVLALDLPPAEQRRVLMTLFVGGSGTNIEARYEVDERTIGMASQATSYSPAGRSLVLLADPPRLRSSLLELQVNAVDANAGGYSAGSTGAERAVQVPLGLVSLDGATGDPIVPTDVLGWSTVAVVAAQIPILARLPQRELAALRQWAHAGGHLVLIPRTPGDLSSPLVRELFGAVRTSEELRIFPGDFVPGAMPALECGRGTAERFGCGASVGRGTAYLLAYDASAPPYVDRPEVRELLRSIAQLALRDPAQTRLPLGRRADELSTQWWDGRPSLSRLRAALDPNEGYRPALGLVGIVMFFYVLVVGPLNFRFVLRRNQPTLALITTPALALGCALVMLFVGYLGKGVLMRYRRVELVEAVEGSALAPARAYAGHFLTAPSQVEIAGRPGGRTMRLAMGGGDDGLVYDHTDEPPRLTGMRGGLWETIFLREDRINDLGGAIRFGYDGDQLVSVTNESSVTLRGAFVLDESRVYPVGEVPPGATRPIPRTPSAVVTSTVLAPRWSDDDTSTTPAELARHLGLDEEVDAPYLRGVIRLLGGPSASPSDALLWAHLDPEPAPDAAPSFARERDLRLLLLRPQPRYELLGRAAAPIQDGSTVWAPEDAPPLPALPPIEPSAEPGSGTANQETP
ncbi:MAG: hypothetical protein M3Y87_21320 [Myxococcota bacterium]|nr:hypothetical protein [Myxococcota bacterium]